MTLTMSASLPGDNKTNQSTIWQLYVAEASAKSLRRCDGGAAETQQQLHSIDSFATVSEFLITLNNQLIYPHAHIISNWP